MPEKTDGGLRKSLNSLVPLLLPVCVAGGAGGLIWWLLSLRAGEAPVIGAYLDPLAAIVFGVSAAFVFVFLVANTDRGDMPRLIALSLAAGIAWEPALNAGTAVVRQEQEEGQVARATTAAEEITRLAAEQPAPASADAEEIVARFDEVTRRASSVDSIAAIEAIREASEPALAAAAPLASDNPRVHAASRRLELRLRAVEQLQAPPGGARLPLDAAAREADAVE